MLLRRGLHPVPAHRVGLGHGRWEDGTAFARTLPAGEYRVTRYLRPCDGNCTLLDPASERCSIRIPVGGPGETHLRALPQALGSCRLAEAG